MFDFAQSVVKPWPIKLPFGGRQITLIELRWSAKHFCDLTVEHQVEGEPERWLFRAIAPLDVIVQEDEGQVVSLWTRRTECCPGEEGFLVVENSPVIRAIRQAEPHLEARTANIRDFVLGTEWAVAHVICQKTPSLERLS